jgi:hypothetical protein
LGKVLSTLSGGLSDYQRISQDRNLWSDFSNEKGRFILPSNIAEGYGRKTILEYLRFLYIAYGSVCELETQIMLSGDLGYLNENHLVKLQKEVREVERMLQALIKIFRK